MPIPLMNFQFSPSPCRRTTTKRSSNSQQGHEAMSKGQQRRERTHPPPLPPRRDMYYDADGTGAGDIPRTESPPPPPLPPRHGESSVAGGGGGGGAGTGPSRSDARSPPLPSDTSGSPLKGSGRGAAATTGGVASQGDTTHSVSLSSSGVGAMAGPGPGGVATTAIGGRPTPSRRRDKNRSAGVLGDPHNLSSSSSPPQPSPRLIKGGFGTGAPQSWTGAAVAEATLAAASRKRPVGGSASVGLKAGGDPGAGSASATMVVAAGAGGAGSGVPTATSASDHRTPGRTRTGSAASGGTPSNSAGLAGVGASTRKHQRAVSGGVVPSAAPAPVPRIATSASPSTSRRSARVTATGGSGASGAQSAGGTAVTVGGAAVTAGARAAGAGSGSARASGAGAGGGAGGHAAGAAVVNATGAGVAAAAGASEGVAAAAGGTGGTGAAAPAAGSAPAGSGWIAVAKYEYMAQGPEQLSFRVGDIVQLHTDKVRVLLGLVDLMGAGRVELPKMSCFSSHNTVLIVVVPPPPVLFSAQVIDPSNISRGFCSSSRYDCGRSLFLHGYRDLMLRSCCELLVEVGIVILNSTAAPGEDEPAFYFRGGWPEKLFASSYGVGQCRYLVPRRAKSPVLTLFRSLTLR